MPHSPCRCADVLGRRFCLATFPLPISLELVSVSPSPKYLEGAGFRKTPGENSRHGGVCGVFILSSLPSPLCGGELSAHGIRTRHGGLGGIKRAREGDSRGRGEIGRCFTG